jgi:hypothetical protein
MILAKAVSSPAAASATTAARLSSIGTTRDVISHSCSGTGQVIQVADTATARGPSVGQGVARHGGHVIAPERSGRLGG